MPMLLSVVAVVGWIALGEVSSGAGERRVTELVRVIRGSGLALAAAFATMFLLRQRLFAVPRIDDGESGAPTSRGERDAGWFVDLRWLAAAVTLGLITCARPEARGHLMVWWIGLVVANLVFLSTSKLWRHHETQIVIQASVDLVLLTGFLNASGGLENPLYMVFLAFVILGRVLVTPGRASVVTGLTMAAFAVLAFGEYLHEGQEIGRAHV